MSHCKNTGSPAPSGSTVNNTVCGCSHKGHISRGYIAKPCKPNCTYTPYYEQPVDCPTPPSPPGTCITLPIYPSGVYGYANTCGGVVWHY